MATSAGALEAGAPADLVLFDPETIDSGPIQLVHDLPGGTGRLFAEAVGVKRVMVAAPDLPALMLDQLVSTSAPSGVTSPSPVTTTVGRGEDMRVSCGSVDEDRAAPPFAHDEGGNVTVVRPPGWP